MKITNDIVTEKAKKAGFDLIGFTDIEILDDETKHLQEWIEMGYHAGMDYMERNLEKRRNVGNILADAKSVISLGLNYYTPFNHKQTEGEGKISRYAWGKDYHLIIWDKLKILERELTEIDNGFKSISYVDTGPIMDKAWAVRAGLGWIGKHTNIINPFIGSWFFIANIITNYTFGNSEIISDHCGTCTACIDACPTNAIANEYMVDANKCISYLTIENKGEIPETFKNKFDGWIFGCDICQDVCPWNVKFSEICNTKEFKPTEGKTSITLSEIDEMGFNNFKIRFNESPVKRAKLKGLKRNASFIKN